tara:strand:- start:466 stop:840 length:375 start_codon:yes stop_codon:yes gene_type:complete
MALIRKTRKLGNSAGVLLPKSLLGSEVKVTVIKRPTDIKKEALRALNNHLDDLQGVYILNLEPGEILAISTSTRAVITKKNLKISLVPLGVIKQDLKSKKELKNKLKKAKPILNKQLLQTLRKL